MLAHADTPAQFPVAVVADASAAKQLAQAAGELCGPHAAFLVESADTTTRVVVRAQPGATSPSRLVGDLLTAGGAAPASVSPLVGNAGTGCANAPLLSWSPDGGAAPRGADVVLDVLAYVERRRALADVLPLLLAALRTQLAAFGVALHTAPERAPRALHFAPAALAHAITMVYALPHGERADEADAALTRQRAAAHGRWGLPADRPLLRVACALPASGSLSASPGSDADATRLRNVHLRCPPSGVPGGVPHLVRGSYAYYHYRQDRFDDAGWGCAYRSCQTLVSWFRAQRYVSAPMPSHGDIQRALVRMGDKEPSFIGSKQWIGAVELMYLLMSEYDVSCKMLTVPTGAEVPQHARALAAHFDAHGTPVMIGGGVLAYTLLGVDWNEHTGDVAFLILDPHYVGPDDAAAVVPTWCGWKRGAEVFQQDAFYNFLLPQRVAAV